MNRPIPKITILLLVSIILIFPAVSYAQESEETDFVSEDDMSANELFEAAVEHMGEGVKRMLKKDQEKWKIEGTESKQKDCKVHRKKCVDMAAKGGFKNRVMEIFRIEFCKEARKVCDGDWHE